MFTLEIISSLISLGLGLGEEKFKEIEHLKFKPISLKV